MSRNSTSPSRGVGFDPDFGQLVTRGSVHPRELAVREKARPRVGRAHDDIGPRSVSVFFVTTSPATRNGRLSALLIHGAGLPPHSRRRCT